MYTDATDATSTTDEIRVTANSSPVQVFDYVQPYDPAELNEWRWRKAALHARAQRALFSGPPSERRVFGPVMRLARAKALKTGTRTRESRARSSVRQLALAGAH